LPPSIAPPSHLSPLLVSSSDHSQPALPRSHSTASSALSCLNRVQMSLRHALDLLHAYSAHRNPLLLYPLLPCWLTRDLLLRTCAHTTTHSMLVLTLPFTFFHEPPQSNPPTSAHYPVPSLPSPLQWRSPSASLSAAVRPQSPGSVRFVSSRFPPPFFSSLALSASTPLTLPSGSPVVIHPPLRSSSSPFPSFPHTNHLIPLRLLLCII
jgi:hypothetical protein